MFRPLVNLPHTFQRWLSTTKPLLSKKLPPRIVIPETDILEVFLKGTGPGGQKINKTSSAVQLKHIPSGIVVKCQETRSRHINRELARKLLQEKLEEKLLGTESRTAIKAKDENKKRASKLKKSRRKYKRLAEEKDREKVANEEEHEERGLSESDEPVVAEEKETVEPPKVI